MKRQKQWGSDGLFTGSSLLCRRKEEGVDSPTSPRSPSLFFPRFMPATQSSAGVGVRSSSAALTNYSMELVVSR